MDLDETSKVIGVIAKVMIFRLPIHNNNLCITGRR